MPPENSPQLHYYRPVSIKTALQLETISAPERIQDICRNRNTRTWGKAPQLTGQPGRWSIARHSRALCSGRGGRPEQGRSAGGELGLGRAGSGAGSASARGWLRGVGSGVSSGGRCGGPVQGRRTRTFTSGSLSARHGTAGSGSAPVPPPPLADPGRLAQRESASLTRKRSQVQILYRPPGRTPSLALENQASGPRTTRANGAKVRPVNAPGEGQPGTAAPHETTPGGPIPGGLRLSRRRRRSRCLGSRRLYR